jgi:hypothetical protein
MRHDAHGACDTMRHEQRRRDALTCGYSPLAAKSLATPFNLAMKMTFLASGRRGDFGRLTCENARAHGGAGW